MQSAKKQKLLLWDPPIKQMPVIHKTKGCYKECLPAAWYHVLLSRFSDLPDLHRSLGENPEELGWEISESFPFASFISVALPLQQQ
jgi:hypothetical protein